MPDFLRLALQQSVEEVMEKMFFVREFEASAAERRRTDSELAAYLTFEGEPSGSLTLRVAPSVARSISADFLGLDEGELNQQQVDEVICELANMICGSVLSRVESASTFRLTTSRVRDAKDGGQETEPQNGEVTLHSAGMAGGSLTVELQTEKRDA